MVDIIKQIALWINLSIWAVIGFICWVPMIARTTAMLSGAILASTITQTNPDYLKVHFENAVNFYSRGFEAIFRVLGANAVQTSSTATSVQINWGKVAIELITTFIFWGTLVLLFYRIFS